MSVIDLEEPITDRIPVETDTPTPPPVDATKAALDQGWKLDKRGRLIIGARGRGGVIYRQGDETPEEAIARDIESRENGRPPKPRPKTEKAPAPSRKTSKELEAALTESLQAPAMLAGLRGDAWVADHIYREAPTLARNLVAASEHNPQMRARLESIAGGETAFGQFIVQIAVANALIAYALPPLVYYFGDRIPGGKRMRETFQVPEKPGKQKPPDRPVDVPVEQPAGAYADPQAT